LDFAPEITSLRNYTGEIPLDQVRVVTHVTQKKFEAVA
jgi:hypothetical protein